MAEDEIIKHTKAVYQVMKNKDMGIRHKLKEVLIEILIIVFAVSLSIWLHGWVESRKERKEEKEFLSGLQLDLRQDITEMKGDSSAYHSIVEGIKYFNKVASGEPLQNDSLNKFVWIFFASVHKESRTSRFEALKGSGKLGIIENKELLNNIIGLYQDIFPSIEQGNKAFTNYNDNRVGTYVETHVKMDQKGNMTNWQELLRAPQMRMAMGRGFYINTILGAYTAGIQSCQQILKQIDAEL